MLRLKLEWVMFEFDKGTGRVGYELAIEVCFKMAKDFSLGGKMRRT